MNVSNTMIAVALLFGVPTSVSYACSCKNESIVSKYSRADSVLSGTVLMGKLVGSTVEYQIEVKEYLKSKSSKAAIEGTISVVEALGHSCAKSLWVGRKYVFFLDGDDKVWMCSGTEPFDFYNDGMDGTTLDDLKEMKNQGRTSEMPNAPR